MPEHTQYILCATDDAVARAVNELSRSPYLILDCEGRDLGCLGGALSVICLGTPSTSAVYLFDVVILEYRALLPLLELLSRPDIRKVVWDGRQDDIELYSHYGVAMTNMLDLQIAEVKGRKLRGELDVQRGQRLKPYFRNWVKIMPAEFAGIQVVVSMQRCLDDHKLTELGAKDVRVATLFKNGGGGEWMKRPLHPILLAYAAKDIQLIALIFRHFEQMGYFDAKALPPLLAQSEHYVTLHRALGRPRQDDPYQCSPVLPLGIVDNLRAQPNAPLYRCMGCLRMMYLDCFSTWIGDRQARWKRDMCRVCFVVAKRNGLSDGRWVGY